MTSPSNNHQTQEKPHGVLRFVSLSLLGILAFVQAWRTPLVVVVRSNSVENYGYSSEGASGIDAAASTQTPTGRDNTQLLGSDTVALKTDDPNTKDYPQKEQQEPQQDDENLSTTTQPLSEPPKINSCQDVVQRMIDWNNCWRRHFLMQSQTNQQPDLSQPIKCTIPIASSGATTSDITNVESMTIEKINAPLYGFSFMGGQGFGRLVDHTVLVCAMSFLLKRPCLLNIVPRDPYYTWQSFVTFKEYNWDPTILHQHSTSTNFHNHDNYAHQIEQLLRKLRRLDVGAWEEGTNNFHESDYFHNQSLVFPMQHPIDRNSPQEGMDYYADKPQPGQILVSPNWGDAWFTKVDVRGILQKDYGCDFNKDFRTVMQNAMYTPTHLALQLHEQRYQRAIQSSQWKGVGSGDSAADPKQLSIKDTTSFYVPRLKFHSLDNSDHQNQQEQERSAYQYGTIHIRTYFLKRDEPQTTLELIATKIRSCVQVATEVYNKEHPHETLPPIDKWWIVADNATAVPFVVNHLHQQHDQGIIPYNDTSLPAPMPIHWYHDYTNTTDADTKHSLDANSLFAHKEMAAPIADWLLLMASTISIVVAEGSFGYTGARGFGKTPLAYCGNGKGLGQLQTFQIFM